MHGPFPSSRILFSEDLCTADLSNPPFVFLTLTYYGRFTSTPRRSAGFAQLLLQGRSKVKGVRDTFLFFPPYSRFQLEELPRCGTCDGRRGRVRVPLFSLSAPLILTFCAGGVMGRLLCNGVLVALRLPSTYTGFLSQLSLQKPIEGLYGESDSEGWEQGNCVFMFTNPSLASISLPC